MSALLMLLIGGGVVATGWRTFRDPVRSWRVRHRGGHLVIAGEEPIAQPIVAGERRAGTPAIVLLAGAVPRWARQARRRGSPVVDPGRGGIGRHLRKARLVILAAAGDDDNVALASTIVADAGELATRPLPLPMIVRIDDLARRDRIEAQLGAEAADGRFLLRFVSLPALLARALLRTGVATRVERRGTESRLLFVLGFTPIIERFLLDALVGGHFGDGRSLEIVVLDPRGAACPDALRACSPFADRLAAPLFVEVALDDPEAVARHIAELVTQHGVPAGVIVDADDAARSTALAVTVDAVIRALDRFPPAFAVHAPAGIGAVPCAPCATFGGASIAAHGELLVEEQREEIARAVHEFYLEGRLDEGEALGSRPPLNDWDRLPEAIRDDNRLLVDLYGQKLQDIGARIVPGRGAPLAFEPAELHDLTRAEHARWMAARLLEGWSHGPVHDAARREHPDLVPFGRLDPAKVARDAEQVRIITHLLGRFGERAVRDLRILVERSTARSLEAQLPLLRHSYPDRALVVLGNPEEPEVRLALTAAAAAGWPVQLVMERHPATLIAALPDGDARRLRALIDGVDRVFVPADGESIKEVLAKLAHHRLDAGSATGEPEARVPAAAARR